MLVQTMRRRQTHCRTQTTADDGALTSSSNDDEAVGAVGVEAVAILRLGSD